MPLLSGVDATRRLTELSPHLRILAISATALEDEIADAILWGADGYVSKDRSLPDLVDAIETIAAGRPILTAGTAQVLCRRIKGPVEESPSLIGAPLVRRELELLELLAAGKTVSQIAGRDLGGRRSARRGYRGDPAEAQDRTTDPDRVARRRHPREGPRVTLR